MLLVSGALGAQEISTLNSSVRALGMGDAYTSLANDSSALFYNPAGLARVHGLNWKILGAGGGVDGVQAYKTISGLKGATTSSNLATSLNPLYGKKAWVGAQAETAFTAPMFGIAIYDHAGTLVKLDNPVYPSLNATLINDYGYTMGIGVPIGPFIQFGFDLKYIKRTGTNQPLGAASLADLTPSNLTRNFTRWGRGYSLDTGFNFILPLPIATGILSAAWKNVGQTRFRPANVDPTFQMPIEDNDITLGLSFDFELPLVSITPSVDYRYLNSAAYQVTRKFNFGLEVGLPLVDIRGGFHEGYYTYGAGFNLGLVRVDVASYGVELGAYPGQIEDRRYVASAIIELGVGDFSVDNSGTGAKAAGGANSASASGSSASGGSGSSRSHSLFGHRKLKQRR